MIINNTTKTTIIVPSDATLRELFAGEQCVKYLSKIFNTNFPITKDREKVDGNKILIGGPKRNEYTKNYITENEFDNILMGVEGVFIKSYDNSVVIAGSYGDNERGTIYATYEFLERFCECCFSAYSNTNIECGEYVPNKNVLVLNNIEYVKKGADTLSREAIIQYGDTAGKVDKGLNVAFLDWLCKNRYNKIITWMSIYEQLKENGLMFEIERRGLLVITGHHDSSKFFLPPFGNKNFREKYYETHPEYYKLMADGTRFLNDNHYGQNIFCSRNENLIKELAKNITVWLKDNQFIDAIYFIPQDGIFDDCVCNDCKKYSKSENYTYLMNEVSKLVAKTYPNVKIMMLLYCDIWEYPKGVKLDSHLLVQESTWHSSGLRNVGNSNGNGVNGTMFEENLLKWKEAGALVSYYDYFMSVYPARNRYIPMADTIQGIAKRVKEKGGYGYGTQIECYNLWNNLFNFYTFARTLYNNLLTMDDCLNKFTTMFGNGATYVKEIIKICEDCVGGNTPLDQGGWYLMQNVNKELVYQLFEKAFNSAQTVLFKNNVRLLRMAFRYSDLETSQEDAVKQYPYYAIKDYKNLSPELSYMTNFDSFYHNYVGYGIMIPVKQNSSCEYKPDKWYNFD